jgi:hypothetical protein
MNPYLIGKAYAAWAAYNANAKKGRLPAFEPKRWAKVVQAINGAGLPAKGRAWSTAQRKKFKATMAKRKESK